MRNLADTSQEDWFSDPRFAIAVYRAAIETGTMESTHFVDPDQLARETLSVD